MRAGRRRQHGGIGWPPRAVAAAVLVGMAGTAGTAGATSAPAHHRRSTRPASVTALQAVVSSVRGVDRAVLRAVHVILEKTILAAHHGTSTTGPGVAPHPIAPPATTPPAATTAGLGSLSSVSGRVEAGNSKTSCIYGPWGSNGWSASASAVGSVLAPITAQTGTTYNCIETFSDADPQWSDWVRPWVTKPAYGFAAWLAQDPAHRTVVLTQNLIPDSEANVADPLTWEQPCAAGAFNAYATQLAQNLVASGFGSSVIRLGHEMNGTWYKDDTGNTLQEQQAWAQCFAREVTAMRAVPGSHLLFDWNVNACYQNIPLANFYPGDPYVDIIGVDQYDGLCNGTQAAPSASTFQAIAGQSSATGLDNVAAFAAAHGKPLSIPEWGLRGLGDDPFFVSGIASFVATHDVAYQSYFDNGDQGVLQLGPTTPLATAVYRQDAGA